MYYVLSSNYWPGSPYYSICFRGDCKVYRVPTAEILVPSEDEHTRSLNLEPFQLPVRVLRIHNRKDGIADILIPGLRSPFRLNVPDNDLIDIR